MNGDDPVFKTAFNPHKETLDWRKWQEWDEDDFEYNLRDVKHCVLASCKYQGKDIVMITPTATHPFGISHYEDSEPIKYSADIALDDDNYDHVVFKQAIRRLEEIDFAAFEKNFLQWFPHRMPEDLELYKRQYYSPIRRGKRKSMESNELYPDTFKVKCQYWDDEMRTKFFEVTDVEVDEVDGSVHEVCGPVNWKEFEEQRGFEGRQIVQKKDLYFLRKKDWGTRYITKAIKIVKRAASMEPDGQF